jgi:hypothetical protein
LKGTPIKVFVFHFSFDVSKKFKEYCEQKNIIFEGIVRVEFKDLITFNNNNYLITDGELPYVRINNTKYRKYVNGVVDHGKIYTKDSLGTFTEVLIV